MAEQSKPKKFVLARMKNSGSLFVLDRLRWEEMRGLGEPFDASEVIAEANEMTSLMRFKDLTREN